MTYRRISLLLPAVLIAALIAGCGPRSDETSTAGGTTGTTTEAPADEVGVTPAEIKKYELGSPQRTALEWWRDAQLNDAEHARLLYLEPPALPDLAGQFNVVSGSLQGEVEVLSSDESGGVTTVELRFEPESGKTRQVTLELQQEGAPWRLNEPRFVDEEVARLQQAEAAGE